MKKIVVATDKAPGALGPYSQAIEIDNLVFTSGQIPINPETGSLITGDVRKAAAQVLDNLKAILTEAGTSLDNAIKTTVYLKDISDFAAVNEIYATYFTEKPPARSCVQIAKLPLDAMLEIEVIATKE